MGFADKFTPACALSSLSWVSMKPAARVARLASRFLGQERELKGLKERGEWAVTAGILKPWLLSIYEPPRGTLSSTISSLLDEIQRQRKIRLKRSENRPWTWSAPKHEERLRVVSESLYGIVRKCLPYNGGETLERSPNSCVALSTIGGILMAVDTTPDANIRVYMRHRETGRIKVVITKKRANYSRREWTMTKLLMCLAPTSVERSLFSGHVIKPNFDRCGFEIDGMFHPWQHVSKIIEGESQAMITPFYESDV